MRRTKKMPSFNAVAAGGTAINNLPIGLSYHRLIIRYKRGATPADATSAQFTADINEIRLVLDGTVIWRLTGGELVALNAYYGKAHRDGVFPMFFSRPWTRTAEGEDSLMLGTADVQTLTLEIDINSAAVNPTLDLYAVQGDPAPLGTFVTVRPHSKNASATGEIEIQDVPNRGPYAGFALHFTTANISQVVMEANQRIVFEADTAIAQRLSDDAVPPRVWQTGYWHVDFLHTNRHLDGLPLDLQAISLRPTMTATGTFKVLVERAENRRTTAAAQARGAAT